MVRQARARIYWFETASRWAIDGTPLADPHRTQMFSGSMRQQCGAIFNGMVKAWVVDDAHLATAMDVVTLYYGQYEFVPRPAPERAAPPPPSPPPPRPRPRPRSSAFAIFCTLVGCDDSGNLSYERARALYRRAAARLHPDAGGSSDKMASLNVAWVAVRNMLS